MKERNHHRPFPSCMVGMYTFPGGAYEESDGNLMITALREIFEEAGVVFGNHQPATIPQWRNMIQQTPIKFHELLSASSPKPSHTFASSCFHFCSFQTPDFEKKKFTTLFFLKEAKPSDYHSMSADGVETSSLLWIDPSKALELNAEGKMVFLPPQFYILSELQSARTRDQLWKQLLQHNGASSSSCDPYLSLYHPDQIYDLTDSRGYPVLKPAPLVNSSAPVTPQQQKTEVKGANKVHDELILTLPYDEKHPDYPGQEGERHRITCTLPMGVKGYHLDKAHAERSPVE
jgi:8-oxo-dGTP pyrophosphatase MutT (NUDIX family)